MSMYYTLYKQHIRVVTTEAKAGVLILIGVPPRLSGGEG
jgi:hypothetical protein